MRLSEYRFMIEIDRIPSDTDFLMLVPHLGLDDKKKIILIRRQLKKNKRLAKQESESLD